MWYTKKKDCSCLCCRKVSVRSVDVKRHSNATQETQREYAEVKCTQYLFVISTKVKRHINTQHQTQKDHSCLKCTKVFSITTELIPYPGMQHNLFIEQLQLFTNERMK